MRKRGKRKSDQTSDVSEPPLKSPTPTYVLHTPRASDDRFTCLVLPGACKTAATAPAHMSISGYQRTEILVFLPG